MALNALQVWTEPHTLVKRGIIWLDGVVVSQIVLAVPDSDLTDGFYDESQRRIEAPDA